MNTRTLRLGIAAPLLGVVGVMVGVAAMSATPVEAAEVDMASPLLVSTRDDLRLCVQVSEQLGDRQAAILDEVERSVARLTDTHVDWDQAYGAMRFAGVDEACKVSVPDGELDEADASALGGGFVKTPSDYRAVILVLDDDTADRVLGKRDVAHAPYEMMALSEHEAVEVTNAVVVRESAMGGATFMEDYLPVAVSLAPTHSPEVPTDELSSMPKEGVVGDGTAG